MTPVLVALGGAAGSVLRYLTDRKVQQWRDSPFPFGTLTVNIAGSFLLGFLSGWLLHGAEPSSVRALVAVGFCGGLTTFSTFGYETVRLFLEKTRLYAVLNVLVTVAAGVASGGLGLLLATVTFT
ncbi:CrcB protein [Amycolatopsis mediterranei S699]|uniref:Fluoride-specific ion channel FluC n=2 Tax=Amycolatopsis mediterranei TaxID=33910 RepID=A0A0H3D0P2_AMYMU|nr:fluoride efflux transporter CrcB [Amycolatopsis mediterranei]ADJ44484.1 CrcB protein [Amycolatopsis mediterranei U32]AEK41222.1 CrcB protein [Amycolatopsis mediterranei S699]AFO76197.1 CrcB protein [Amycolatopsis mediterranei S699]AGT83326.1 CrcB protein [Amycolatopsis mediterranei RB]KDO07159.1 chromosome condensation protein CrcB [Amycolatopsis mediterranei]